VRARSSDDSAWQLSARLDPERGALITAAIDQLGRVEELSPADALVRLAEIGLAALADMPGAPAAPTPAVGICVAWDGQRLDLGYAVAVLAHRRDRAQNRTRA